jgi:acyl dehydratase
MFLSPLGERLGEGVPHDLRFNPLTQPLPQGGEEYEETRMQLDKKVIGHEFEAFSTTVEAGKVKLFCKAIGEEDPIYADEAAAKAAGYRAVPVPPTFLQAITNDDPGKGGLLRLLNVDIGLILHGEQHYDYYAPVYVGDKITCQAKVTDMYDKKGGALWFVVSETSLKDQSGKLVAKGTGITVVRNPDAAKK